MSRALSQPSPAVSDETVLLDGEKRPRYRQRASTGQVGQRLGIPLSQLRRGRQADSRRKDASPGVAAAASTNQAGRGFGVGAAAGTMSALSPPPYPGAEVRTNLEGAVTAAIGGGGGGDVVLSCHVVSAADRFAPQQSFSGRKPIAITFVAFSPKYLLGCRARLLSYMIPSFHYLCEGDLLISPTLSPVFCFFSRMSHRPSRGGPRQP